MQMRGGREERAHLAQGSWLSSLVLQRMVEVLVTHNNDKVVAGFLLCRKKKRFVVEKEKERLAVVVSIVDKEMG
jgi:hypothetical protein